jgi:hypothetical protein
MTDIDKGRISTIHMIRQRAETYTVGCWIELKSGGFVITGRFVGVHDCNDATDICLVDLEDSQTMTVTEYVAQQKRGKK